MEKENQTQNSLISYGIIAFIVALWLVMELLGITWVDLLIAKQKFIVPALEHLIALKLHSMKHNPKLRENKDMPDIVELIKRNNVKVKSKEFKELCLKYGTEGFYKKILKSI